MALIYFYFRTFIYSFRCCSYLCIQVQFLIVPENTDLNLNPFGSVSRQQMCTYVNIIPDWSIYSHGKSSDDVFGFHITQRLQIINEESVNNVFVLHTPVYWTCKCVRSHCAWQFFYTHKTIKVSTFMIIICCFNITFKAVNCYSYIFC